MVFGRLACRVGVAILLCALIAPGCTTVPVGIVVHIRDGKTIGVWSHSGLRKVDAQPACRFIAPAGDFSYFMADDNPSIMLLDARSDPPRVVSTAILPGSSVCGLGTGGHPTRAAIVVTAGDRAALWVCDSALRLEKLCELPLQNAADARYPRTYYAVSWSADASRVVVSPLARDSRMGDTQGAIVDVPARRTHRIDGFRSLYFVSNTRLVGARPMRRERVVTFEVALSDEGVAIRDERVVARGQHLAGADSRSGVFALRRPPFALMYAADLVDLYREDGWPIGGVPEAQPLGCRIFITSHANR